MRAYATTAGRIRKAMLASAVGSFQSLGSWRAKDMRTFTAQITPRIVGAQRQMESVTDAYLRTLLADIFRGPRPAPRLQPRAALQLRGVDPAVVYERPFHQLWRDLSEDHSWQDSFEASLRRLESLVATDLQLAKTHAARDALEDEPRVVGFRRVLRGPTSCGLCVVASTQRYHKGELLPIHPGCDCDVAAIVGSTDPGQIINEPLLEDVHDAIEKTFGVSDRSARAPDYREFLVVHEHGEIGPVLARAGDHFTGPDDLKRGDS